MRVLFFNEGNLGAHVMGQGQLAQALSTGLPYAPDMQARFAGLTPMGRVERAIATRPIEPLAHYDFALRTLRWHAVQSLRARAAIAGELRLWPADVVHVHSQSIAFALSEHSARAPVALSLDTTVADWRSMPAWSSSEQAAVALAPSRALERRALQRCSLALAWTGWTRRSAEQAAPRAHVVEHHPGLDLERYRPAARRPRERLKVLFVGGRFAEKGGEDLLAVLADRLGQTVELDLVTPAEVEPRPGVNVHRLGPSDPQLLDLQQQADLFCLPTYGDAVPWAVLEAMACGTPVLATRVGGIPDLLDDGDAGSLVDHGDRRGLRAALEQLLDDPQRRADLAGLARERCEQRYDARRQVPRLAELLRELNGDGLTPPRRA
ncbi:MAG TPA: glycosyltransferase family 4 protein [Solirubrobacteraceae bacterium]|nr:glycosyltransferase family 4 protein [Solirubrobacteraceae bacterium]